MDGLNTFKVIKEHLRYKQVRVFLKDENSFCRENALLNIILGKYNVRVS
jgi:hypothetical protein